MLSSGISTTGNRVEINVNIGNTTGFVSSSSDRSIQTENTSQSRLSDISPVARASEPQPRLLIARSWMRQWDSEKAHNALEQSDSLFFQRSGSEYVPAPNFHFNNLILGGKFPAAEDTLGGLQPSETAVMDVLDPDVEKVDHVHVDGISQVLIDINVMSHEEAQYLRGRKGIDHVIQSNIGGPNMRAGSLLEAGQLWIDGESPGCSCLICSRVPNVVEKLEENKQLTPRDVLPLTTIPRLHDVVDNMLKPRVKIAMGSQGRISDAMYQDYPSAAVGHESYMVSERSDVSVNDFNLELDPKGILKQNKAPKGYIYSKGFLWENGKDMIRNAGDPDKDAFGFIYIRKDKFNQDLVERAGGMFNPQKTASQLKGN